MIKFCSECGTKAEYKFSPPKFCSNCGASMGGTKVERPTTPSREVSRTNKIQAISDSETDAEYVPDISKLEYEIDTYGSQYNQTIGSLGGKSMPQRRKIVKRDIDDFR